MLEPNAPETQDPRTPEPEEDEAPKPLHPAVITAAEAMCNAALHLMRDPDTNNINEAIHALRTAADFIAGDHPPEPTFLQTLGETIEKNLPVFMELAMRLGAQIGREPAPITGCWDQGLGRNGPVYSNYGLTPQQYERFKDRLREAEEVAGDLEVADEAMEAPIGHPRRPPDPVP